MKNRGRYKHGGNLVRAAERSRSEGKGTKEGENHPGPSTDAETKTDSQGTVQAARMCFDLFILLIKITCVPHSRAESCRRCGDQGRRLAEGSGPYHRANLVCQGRNLFVFFRIFLFQMHYSGQWTCT